MKEIYENGTYLTDNPSWHQEDSPWKAIQINKIIKNNKLHPKTICEVGCGAGEILNLLSQQYDQGQKFFGYDISSQAFELSKVKTKTNLIFLHRDIVEEKNVFYDLIMAIDVFEHVEDYLTFLKALKKKGDYKLFHIPLNISVQTVLRTSPISMARKIAGHLHYFTKETALETLKATGYDIIDYFYTESSLELSKRDWKTHLLNIPRRLMFSINQDLTVRILGGYSLLVLCK